MTDARGTLWTVGHSTLSLEDFLALLQAHAIQAVADVRRWPASRRQPHFGEAALAPALAACGLDYRWLPALGGRRQPRPDSPNRGWRNESFRGYADYLDTPEFAAGLEELLALAGHRRTAILCAERHWTSCHRGLIADVLKLRGLEVLHVLDRSRVEIHPYTGPARVTEGRLGYPGEDMPGKGMPQQDDLFD
jgi:uncharacterized protein (DUF488 family)